MLYALLYLFEARRSGGATMRTHDAIQRMVTNHTGGGLFTPLRVVPGKKSA
jgi:hypothetical protein